MKPRTLEKVTRAAGAARAADQQLRDAIAQARDDGHPVPSIAAAAGVTRSAIYQRLRKGTT